MTTTTESPDINSTAAGHHAMGVLVAGAAAVALFALFGTAWPGAAETTVASVPAQLVDQSTAQTPQIRLVDDDDDQAQQAENNAIQTMIQSEQQAEQQNEQAQQQFIQDQLQAQQTEQQAGQ
ncbi:MAG TPA: hypothetical protein VGG53_14060 [Mycobacterium sp.]|jgi:hypothetical protein|uniref:hypothetical protein n=1 Tax=Mycobacterium sp. TaxID=1785 RepID=UPI002F40F5C4